VSAPPKQKAPAGERDAVMGFETSDRTLPERPMIVKPKPFGALLVELQGILNDWRELMDRRGCGRR